jgi:hydroxymethylpyrimidine pyrophosphatase-like HAD family hydrolase
MLIALDFDGTYTEDSDMWDDIIKIMHRRGHKVVIVTMRYQDDPDESINKYFPFQTVYYTNRKAKKPFMDELGIMIDVWIDDSPNWLLNDSL